MKPARFHEADDSQSNALWQQDNVALTSVGVDVGSAGTQVVLSRLHLRRMGEHLTSRYIVTRREILYCSDLHFTPFGADDLIEADALGRFLDEAYARAGMTVEMVDTGAVILTGEALRRPNAKRIATVVAERAGDLVCATAGHELEAHLAAYGSGAARLSSQLGIRLLNVDIGGGTTKLAVVDGGRVVASAALGVGSRLVAVDDDELLIRLESIALERAMGKSIGYSKGDPFTPEQRREMAQALSVELERAVWGAGGSESALWLTTPLPAPFGIDPVDGVVYSGGVAEYIGGGEARDFGDLGQFLAEEIYGVFAGHRLREYRPDQRIRATVIGASSHTVQLSGNTCWIGQNEHLLPRRNVEVIAVDCESLDAPDLIEAQISRALDGRPKSEALAIALDWTSDPHYSNVLELAKLVAGLLGSSLSHVAKLYVLVNGDIAMTLGRILAEELHVRRPLIVLDGLALRQFDYVDMGRVRRPSSTVPVTIKSLHFPFMPLAETG